MSIDWENVLLETRKLDPNIYGLLRSCKRYKLSNGTLWLTYASHVLARYISKPESVKTVNRVFRNLYSEDVFEIVCVNYEGLEFNFEEEERKARAVDGNGKKYLHSIGTVSPPEESYQDKRRKIYDEYLKSDDWRVLRQQILDFWGNRCALCHSDKFLHVHHRTYERLGHEIFSDLLPLCKRCHEKHHDVMDTIETIYYDSPF